VASGGGVPNHSRSDCIQQDQEDKVVVVSLAINKLISNSILNKDDSN
jgi:hypothetical protein